MAFLFLLLVPLAIGLFVTVARFILAPINRLVSTIKAPTRFQITDLVSLMLLLQFLLAAISGLAGFYEREFEVGSIAAIVILSVPVLLLWVGGVSYISQAQINSPLRRIVFVTFVLPGTLALMMASAAAGVALIAGTMAVGFERGNLLLIAVAAIFIVLPLSCLAMRALVDWIARGAPQQSSPPSGFSR